jgi:AAA domain
MLPACLHVHVRAKGGAMKTKPAHAEPSTVLLIPDTVVELRIPIHDKRVVSGFFDDQDKLLEATREWDGRAPAIYWSLNPVDPKLLGRVYNRLEDYSKQTTTDKDIVRRTWLPLDFDVANPAGISSSDVEHAAALLRARECLSWLISLGFSSWVRADSGNGGHIALRIDLPNDEESTGLVKKCVHAVSFRYSDGDVKVDETVFNAGRIWKCYGTWACKGDDTPERPHRQARVLETAPQLVPEPRAVLETLASFCPPEPKQHAKSTGKAFDLAHWIAAHHLDVRGPDPWNGGQKWIFEICPWNAEHRNRSAGIFQLPNGAIGARCHHNGCTGKDWQALRALYEPDRKKSGNGHDTDWRDVEEDAPFEEDAGAPGAAHKATPALFTPVIRCAKDIEQEDINYLWYPRLILGKLGILGGDAGTGKSYLTAALATALSHGSWPFFLQGKESLRTPGHTLFITSEDGIEDTYKARLTDLGADQSFIHFLDGKLDWKGNLQRVVLNDKDIIIRSITQCQAKLVVFDPLQSFLPRGTKMSEMETVAPVLTALLEAARETVAHILMVGHLSKARQENAGYRFLGSVEWYNKARTAMLIVKNPDTPDTDRILYHIKNSVGRAAPAVGFSIAETNQPIFLWGTQTDVKVEDVLAGDPHASHSKEKRAEEFLHEELKAGERETESLKESAKSLGISWRTIWEAKTKLNIRAHKDGFQGKWFWALS